MRKAAVLTVPGLGGSGPNHWQTLWQHTPDISRVEQRDWDDPVLDLPRVVGPSWMFAHQGVGGSELWR